MLHTLIRKQIVSGTAEDVWQFISSPLNLNKITPPTMRFLILGDLSALQHMYPGQIIEYRVSPFKGYSSHWVTEITHVEQGRYFVDEQRFGPYSFWHHQHIIEQAPGGVEMTDIVHYKLPFGFLGRILNWLLVAPRLKQIFDYREQAMTQAFSKSSQKQV